MSLNGKTKGRRMEYDPVRGPVAPSHTRHPAASEMVLTMANIGPEAKPLELVGAEKGSAGLGREYLPIPERQRNYPQQVTLEYGGGYVDISGAHPNGFVDRTRLEAGLHYIWTDEVVEMPVSALPFNETGKPGDSFYGQLLHFKRRIEMNGAWWAVVKGLSRNTGFVAQTKPEPPSSGETQRPPDRFYQGPASGTAWFTLDVPRPATSARPVPAISIMPGK